MSAGKFLTAEWRYLTMLNYEIDPNVLLPYMPAGAELDFWNNTTFVSVVGFMFLNTRVLGVPIPFHVNFEEVNLRFYVRRLGEEGWRRGVVFIKEIVPKSAIAAVARTLYNENYVALPMRHAFEPNDDSSQLHIEYGWQFNRRWNYIRVKTIGEKQPIIAGSEEEFITEHYWGYSAQKDGGTVEYQVEHSRWHVWQVSKCELDCDVADLYGGVFIEALQRQPSSAFVADGSAVTVRRGVRI